MADCYRVRPQQIDVQALYTSDPNGPYWYTKGFNLTAVYTLALAGLLSLSVALVPALSLISPFSWFVGALAGFTIYPMLARHPRLGLNAQQNLS